MELVVIFPFHVSVVGLPAPSQEGAFEGAKGGKGGGMGGATSGVFIILNVIA
jgi:hypothetical protein